MANGVMADDGLLAMRGAVRRALRNMVKDVMQLICVMEDQG